MKSLQTLWMAAAACAFAAGLCRADERAQPLANLPAEMAQLRIEIRILQLDFYYFQADSLARIIAMSESESARVQDRLRRVEKEEQNLSDEIASAGLRSTAALSETERLELAGLTASRELRPGSDMIRILAEKENLKRQLSEQAQQIQSERRRCQSALETANRLQAEMTQVKAAVPAR